MASMLVEMSDGVRLAVRRRDGGAGPVVALAADWACSAAAAGDLEEHLAAHGCTVVTWDPRGTGHSDRPDTGYDLARQAADAEAVLAAACPGTPVHWVGLGYGSIVVLTVAARGGASVASLALVPPVVPGTLSAARRDLLLRAVEDWPRAADLLAGSAARTLAPAVLAAVGRDIGHTTRAAALAQLVVMGDAAALPMPGRIQVSTLLVVGELDSWTARGAVRERLLPLLAGVRWANVPGVGRRPDLEAPDVVAADLAAWAWDPEAGPADDGEPSPDTQRAPRDGPTAEPPAAVGPAPFWNPAGAKPDRPAPGSPATLP